jgi:hypothetical protein
MTYAHHFFDVSQRSRRERKMDKKLIVLFLMLFNIFSLHAENIIQGTECGHMGDVFSKNYSKMAMDLIGEYEGINSDGEACYVEVRPSSYIHIPKDIYLNQNFEDYRLDFFFEKVHLLNNKDKSSRVCISTLARNGDQFINFLESNKKIASIDARTSKVLLSNHMIHLEKSSLINLNVYFNQYRELKAYKIIYSKDKFFNSAYYVEQCDQLQKL